MDFFYKPVIPERCPDCKGTGRKPYPYSFYPCPRCEGTGRIVHLTLTYLVDTDTSGQYGKPMFAGVIERPYREDDC